MLLNIIARNWKNSMNGCTWHLRVIMASFNLTNCSCWGSPSNGCHLVGANCNSQFTLYGHISGMSYIQRYCYTLAQCVSIEHFWSNPWYFSHATLTAIVNSRNGNWKWKTEFEKLKLKSEISSNASREVATSFYILYNANRWWWKTFTVFMD